MDKHDLTKLEAKIKEVASHLASIGSGAGGPKGAAGASSGALIDLLPIIHRPGWTTPAELLFVNGILDSMLTHAKTLAGLQHALIAGSAAVGAAG